jgi:hypothetical protein
MTKKTQQLVEALRKQWPYPDYAFIEEFRGGTGYGISNRADAIAMDLWPSRGGLELIGFEIKTSRADWLNELKQPKKCEAIKQYCDKWYLVTDNQYIVDTFKNEIPDDWGYMYIEAHTKNYIPTFKIAKEAPKLQPKPVNKHFIASLMRRASAQFNEVIINGQKYIKL